MEIFLQIVSSIQWRGGGGVHFEKWIAHSSHLVNRMHAKGGISFFAFSHHGKTF
jgi:hypothetical protein